MKTIREPSRQVPIIGDFDVAVVGGGPGGWPAAIAAARLGARVLLVERYGFLGGLATAGFIGPILGHKVYGTEAEPAIGGIAEELCRRMADLGGAVPWEESLKQWGVPFDVETMKYVLDRMVEEAGITLRLHTLNVDAVVTASRIDAAILESKSGREAVAARAFVDATGDADLAFRAGAALTKGRSADGAMQSMGSMFRIGGVGEMSQEDRKLGQEHLSEAIESGRLYMYNPGTGHQGSTLRDDELTPNVTRAAGDPTDADSLTAAELKVRRETWDIVRFYRDRVPGLQNAYLIATPTQVGPRESRQVVGESRITGDDVRAGAKSDDSIARCAYWIDIHCPLGRVVNRTHLCSIQCPNDPPCIMFESFKADLPDELYPPGGDYFSIPYGCLLAKGMDNLLVSGRCISADHQAMAATRVMGTCMAIGQAAGTAAAMFADQGVPARELAVAALRKTLTDSGHLV
jgi:hypothetical protein